GSKGASRFVANLASEMDGGKIELRLDSVDGPHLGTLTVARTGGRDQWQQQSVPVSGATGVHDLYLIFRGQGEPTMFEFDYWRFDRK
ncbi:MAG: carbohydrate-binding protein, partial [Burkholderiales bacterium]|nr:carbohydrate-binding protein [Burkholderiales bacterium]